MLLTNLRSIQHQDMVNISIEGNMISAVTASSKNENAESISFEQATVFPGLINSHDHLDFNCFPMLGNRQYRNYTIWGKHIHTAYKKEINEVLRVPENLRVLWGMYKNLLAGVTTVVNHGAVLKIKDPLINIIQDVQNLHSVSYQKQWKWKLNNPFRKNETCVIHVGEGVDDKSSAEIDALLKWNLLNRKLVGIHAVAMNKVQAEKFNAIVWCPGSNDFLLGNTADIKNLKAATAVIFGTDSTLTGHWNIWEHLRLARTKKMVTDEELFSMVTTTAAKTWKLNNGLISAGKDADIVIARTAGSRWDDLYNIDPASILMVIQQGKIRLFDKELLHELDRKGFDLRPFNPVGLHGAEKYVEGKLPALMETIRQYYPGAAFPLDTHVETKMTADA